MDQALEMPHFKVEKIGAHDWLLLESYTVYVRGQKITVPAGFKTNLASVPRLMYRIFPPTDSYDAAAVVHDYLYSLPSFDRKEADAIFLELMGRCGTPAWQRYAMWGAVRLFGGWYKAASLALVICILSLWGCRMAYVNSPVIKIPEGAKDCMVEVKIYAHDRQEVIQTKEVPIDIARQATIKPGVMP